MRRTNKHSRISHKFNIMSLKYKVKLQVFKRFKFLSLQTSHHHGLTSPHFHSKLQQGKLHQVWGLQDHNSTILVPSNCPLPCPAPHNSQTVPKVSL